MHHPIALGDPAAAGTVEPDRMHLVEIGHCPELVGNVAEFADRRDVTVHRIDRLEADELRSAWGDALDPPRESGGVVVAEDVLFGAAVADAGNHRGVVAGV